jgi:hypothetical protein
MIPEISLEPDGQIIPDRPVKQLSAIVAADGLFLCAELMI